MVTLFHIGKGRWSLDLLLRFKPLHSAPPYQMFIVSKVMKYKGSIKMSTLIEGDIASIQPRVSYHYAGVRILIDEAMGSSVSLTSFPDAVTKQSDKRHSEEEEFISVYTSKYSPSWGDINRAEAATAFTSHPMY